MGTIFVDKIKNNVGGATVQVDEIVNISGDSDSGINLATNDTIKFNIAGVEKARMDSSGNVLIGHTNLNSPVADSGAGITLKSSGEIQAGLAGTVLKLNRENSDGNVVDFRQDGSTKGKIDTGSASMAIFATGANNGGWSFGDGAAILPMKDSGLADNNMDLGASGNRMDDIFATNGTIQTSDKNEKNTITDSDLGLDFVSRLSPKSYKFNNKTRTHYGLIAQDVETVLGYVKKDASQFAGFCKDDISEKQDGSEYRYGLRYHEFISPMIQAIKDLKEEVDTLKAKVAALESK